MAANSSQYLEWHGQQYRVRVKVPAKLRDIIGRGKLVHPLRTADLKEANERKWLHVARLKEVIAAADKANRTGDPKAAEALALRLSRDEEGTQYATEIRAEQIEREAGTEAAKTFAGIASGRLTPLDHHADAFAKHQGYRLKTAGDFTRVLGWLRDWLKETSQPVAIEHVSRNVAGRFISEFLVVGRSQHKASAYLAFLRQYWRWLREKGHVATEANPWLDQTFPASPRVKRDAEPDELASCRAFGGTVDMVVRVALGLVLSLLCATRAAAYCSEPSAPYCATSYGSFDDEWEFRQCKSEMESYQSDVESFVECNKREADDAVEKAQSENASAISDFNDAVQSFNNRAHQ